MSLRITPGKAQPSSISVAQTASISVAGVHDTLRHGNKSFAADVNSRHPLEARLQNWEATQEELRMETLKRLYGVAEPVRRQMELKLCGADDFRPTALGGPDNLHLDILRGKDTTLDVEDVFDGRDMANIDFHTELEARMR